MTVKKAQKNNILEKPEQKPLTIGDVTLDSPFLLAPLAGITDAPLRRICRQMGASLTYSEMVSAKGLFYNDKKTEQLLFLYEDEGPTAFQIFGREPEIIAYAAEALDSRPNVILDINMGCPVPKIVKNGEGSALLQDPPLIERIVSAAATHTRKPVTVKIRIGFGGRVNAVEAARAAEAGGAAAITVHGRTREQYYSGAADWEEIGRVRQAVNIPVIANGDVTDAESARAIREQTGCSLVMIGRAAMGNPWIFRDLVRQEHGLSPLPAPDLQDRIEMMLRQLAELRELKGDYTAVREMRKICGWYLKGVPGSAAFRGAVNQITKP